MTDSKKSARALLLFLLIVFSAVTTYLLYPPVSPISPLGLSLALPNEVKKDYEILGFAPFWNIKKITPESLATITDFAYFTLYLNGQGSIFTHVNRREQEPGYTNYRRLLENPLTDKPLTLTFMPRDQDSLAGILNYQGNRLNCIKTIVSAVTESRASGVNVDFEPLGIITSAQKDSFTVFIQALRKELNNLGNPVKLSISIYPSAASRPRLWDLDALHPSVDSFVVMTYDYTLPGSSTTGPNSPLRGAGTLFEHDILTNLAEITAIVPADKILLGVPFYGYEWDTDDTTKYTPTEARGSVASLERISELMKENTLELLWDRNSLTPYAIRREKGEVVSQIYFEDEKSIRLKIDLVKQAGLKGIAIWALGYEGNNPSLWSVISSSLK